MYIIIDDRDIVAGGYANGFDREGVSSAGIEAAEFREWIGKISDTDVSAVEAFLIGDCSEREALSRLIRERSNAPVLCLNERHSLDDTLCLFAAGADDVLRKPVHVREIVARVGAIYLDHLGRAPTEKAPPRRESSPFRPRSLPNVQSGEPHPRPAPNAPANPGGAGETQGADGPRRTPWERKPIPLAAPAGHCRRGARRPSSKI